MEDFDKAKIIELLNNALAKLDILLTEREELKVKDLLNKQNDTKLANMVLNLERPNDGNYNINWALEHDYTDVVKHMLQDPRVDPSAEDN